ncbi:ethanolamine ammonia-lyase subunit EutC [Brevibacillus ruminantium]|uniref:Ethanolamine ammonia-lyase small subunit n=1 Tax=Brevibacillus ruminantium TaxID=2950604 RepID=A0ABY4WFL3_9BACL|nr:ethanolamine ammonia-lyase subunit EutC [Brevibacillus ruminantium]USG65534.1 ethanolamine ammonia-lyase subunit EutC [Brevibacillus ruminantium]
MGQQLDYLVDQVLAQLEKRLGEMSGNASAAQGSAINPAGAERKTGTKAGSRAESVAESNAEHKAEGKTESDAERQFPSQAESTAESSSIEAVQTPLTADASASRAQIPHPKWQEGLQELLESTPARIGVWRTGVRPLTKTMLQLRRDHAAAVDAVYGEVDQAILEAFSLFSVETQYDNIENYLKRPDMGRIINEEGVRLIEERCQKRPQVQIIVSDGLSASAVDANLRDVLPSLYDSLKSYGLSWGTPFFVKGGRVASMDHIGEILQPEVLVLLIGERPGLVTAHSMSAYMCYRPRKGMVESERTVISNIHRQGTSPVEAGAHIGTILSKMLEQKASGVKLVL